jgi:hypothetical protein
MLVEAELLQSHCSHIQLGDCEYELAKDNPDLVGGFVQAEDEAVILCFAGKAHGNFCYFFRYPLVILVNASYERRRAGFYL